MEKFSDVVTTEPVYPEAEYMPDKKDLLGKAIILHSFTKAESSKGEYAVVLAEQDGKKISFSIGGVVFEQLVKAKDKLPLEAKLLEVKGKEGRIYYKLE